VPKLFIIKRIKYVNVNSIANAYGYYGHYQDDASNFKNDMRHVFRRAIIKYATAKVFQDDDDDDDDDDKWHYCVDCSVGPLCYPLITPRYLHAFSTPFPLYSAIYNIINVSLIK